MDARGMDCQVHLETKPHFELGAIVAELGPDEVRVLTRIARRLAVGQRAYGVLAVGTDKRDFSKEGREEIEDFLVYAACAWLKQEVTR